MKITEYFLSKGKVKAHRYRREQYQLSGSDGELNYKIPKKSFPEEIIAAAKKHSI